MNWGETERKWNSESQLNNFWCFHLLHASQEEVFQALWIYGHHIESVRTTELNVTLAKAESGVTQSLRSHPKPPKSLHLDEIATVTSHCSQYQVGSSSWIIELKMLLACFTSWIWLCVVLVVKFEQFNYLVGLDKSLWSSLNFIFILQILLFFFFDKQLPSHPYGIYVLCICMTHVWLQIKRLMLMSSLSQGILLHRASSSWYWTPVWCNWGKQHNILQGKQGGAAVREK